MKSLFLTTALVASFAVAGISASQGEPTYKGLPAGVYNLDKAHASFTWKVSHFGLSNYTARFTRFDAKLDFNPKNPAQSKLSATVDPTSIRTDFLYVQKKDFDKELSNGGGWFNAGKFPKISFKSTGIKLKDDKNGVMTGDLTFLGVTRPVVLDVHFNGAFKQQPLSKKPTLGFSATGKIKRSKFGMTTYVPNIGDDVTLLIEAEFAKDK